MYVDMCVNVESAASGSILHLLQHFLHCYPFVCFHRRMHGSFSCLFLLSLSRSLLIPLLPPRRRVKYYMLYHRSRYRLSLFQKKVFFSRVFFSQLWKTWHNFYLYASRPRRSSILSEWLSDSTIPLCSLSCYIIIQSFMFSKAL